MHAQLNPCGVNKKPPNRKTNVDLDNEKDESPYRDSVRNLTRTEPIPENYFEEVTQEISESFDDRLIDPES